MTHYGIDISSHDHDSGQVDFGAAYSYLKQQGEEPFLFIKATEGLSYTNPFFINDLQAAKQAGFKAIAAYHFNHPQDSGVQQAAFFRSVAGSIPGALDDETTDNLSWAIVGSEVTAFLNQPSEIDDIRYTYATFFFNENGVPTRALFWPIVNNPKPSGIVVSQDQRAVPGFPVGVTDYDTWTGTEDQFNEYFRLGGHVPSKVVPVPVLNSSVASTGGLAADNATPARLDVFMTGNDGKLYHKWFIAATGWFGPDVITDAI